MESSINTALFCLKNLGWSIIPIKTKTKLPLVSWKEFQTRRPTEEEIKTWWLQYPDAGIAVVTGKISNLIIVDIDPLHGGSNEAFKKNRYYLR